MKTLDLEKDVKEKIKEVKEKAHKRAENIKVKAENIKKEVKEKVQEIKEDVLEEKTLTELKAMAKAKDIKGYSTMKKQELIDALK